MRWLILCHGAKVNSTSKATMARRSSMFLSTLREKLLAGSILAGMMAAAPITQALAQQKAAPADFSSNNVAWVELNGGGPFYEPVPGRVPPVSQAHPFVPNGVGRPHFVSPISAIRTSSHG
jgi:hypothetical protein